MKFGTLPRKLLAMRYPHETHGMVSCIVPPTGVGCSYYNNYYYYHGVIMTLHVAEIIFTYIL